MSALPPTYREFLPPALFFLILSAIALLFASIPRWRRAWHWGRTRETYPISRRGCLMICLAFIVMAMGPIGALLGYYPGSLAMLFILAGFVICIIAGFLDQYASRKS
jgi:hypothetical protein